jgi:lipid-A-disaccharide synthase
VKIYVIAGEASGDLHGANLVRALRTLRPDVQVRAWGGDRMAAAGAEVVKHYRDLAFMGFVEVLANLRTIMGNMAFCKRDIRHFDPDAVVFVDYPGFNLRMARWLRKERDAGRSRAKAMYYIAPQVWAWHGKRVHAMRRDLDLVIPILPFEKAFFEKHNVHTEYVGHPLLDAIGPMPDVLADDRTITLLPGSRKQEVWRILPIMLSVVPYFPDYQFVIAASEALPLAIYEDFAKKMPRVRVVQGDTYEVLKKSCAALVKSGTSTLETALLGVPQVVCYTGNRISYEIAKRVVNIKYISLVNLIADKPVVEELIQHRFHTEEAVRALNDILQPDRAAQLRQEYRQVRQLLGETGASERAAVLILRNF